VTLFYSTNTGGAYQRLAMQRPLPIDASPADVFRAEIPGVPAGERVRYYVAAAANDEAGTLAFSPATAERDVHEYWVSFPTNSLSPVLLNEFMADNLSTLADPQGDYDDWIELRNLTSESLDVSGGYLSDDPENPRKWRIPEGTLIPANGYLLVWADEDGQDSPGLHANFRLSADGEQIFLLDRDENNNALLDSVSFGPQEMDQSYGRSPADPTQFQVLQPTPGRANSSR
jgi:hypothetical protein